MARAHASLAGLKSMSTTIAAEGIEDCRRCCGGHGYLACSGLPELSGNFLQQVTVEVRCTRVCVAPSQTADPQTDRHSHAFNLFTHGTIHHMLHRATTCS